MFIHASLVNHTSHVSGALEVMCEQLLYSSRQKEYFHPQGTVCLPQQLWSGSRVCWWNSSNSKHIHYRWNFRLVVCRWVWCLSGGNGAGAWEVEEGSSLSFSSEDLQLWSWRRTLALGSPGKAENPEKRGKWCWVSQHGPSWNRRNEWATLSNNSIAPVCLS